MMTVKYTDLLSIKKSDCASPLARSRTRDSRISACKYLYVWFSRRRNAVAFERRNVSARDSDKISRLTVRYIVGTSISCHSRNGPCVGLFFVLFLNYTQLCQRKVREYSLDGMKAHSTLMTRLYLASLFLFIFIFLFFSFPLCIMRNCAHLTTTKLGSLSVTTHIRVYRCCADIRGPWTKTRQIYVATRIYQNRFQSNGLYTSSNNSLSSTL